MRKADWSDVQHENPIIHSHGQEKIAAEGACGARMRMLIGPDEGAKNFHMRHFEIAPGGHTPHPSHSYEHEIVVLKGERVTNAEHGDRPFKAGDVLFVPGDERHQFVNGASEPCEFICLIPAPRECGS